MLAFLLFWDGRIICVDLQALSNIEFAAPSREMLASVDTVRLEVCGEEYAAILAPFFASVPISSEKNSGKNVSHVWRTELCGIAEAVSNPFTRSRSRKEIQDAGHLIEVTRLLSGKEQGVMANSVIERSPGQIYVLDQGLPMRSVASHCHVQQIYVPKTLLGVPDAALACESVISASNPAGLLLHASMTELLEGFKSDPNQVSIETLNGFLALLKVNLGIHPQREDVRSRLRKSLCAKICTFIERNLTEPRLSTITILENYGVSRASLYRMFEHHGGVRTYITQRRVARAVLEIEDSLGVRGGLRRAADRWGFSSQPNFNRTIRKAFGTNPSGLFENVCRVPRANFDSQHLLSDLADRLAVA